MQGMKKVSPWEADMIQCGETSELVWAWHPDGGAPLGEYSIRWGTTLRVREDEAAVLLYRNEGGIEQDHIVGPFDQMLRPVNLPVLNRLQGAPSRGDRPFQAAVFFISLDKRIEYSFEVPYFNIFESGHPDCGVPVAVFGTMGYKITDYRRFIRLNRLTEFDQGVFEARLYDAAVRIVRETVAAAPEAQRVSVIQLESRIKPIAAVIEAALRTYLAETFGVSVSGVDVEAIRIDHLSEGYRCLIDNARTGRRYFIAEAGESIGPFDRSAINRMIASGRVGESTLLWHKGMAQWCAAKNMSDFEESFAEMPPMPPSAD